MPDKPMTLGPFYPAMYGPIAAFWAEMFATRVRYTGVSFGYQTGAAS